MIKQEQISETLVRTYSDRGVKIHGGFPEADYDEAIDPISAGRMYTETNIPVSAPEAPEGMQEAAAYMLEMKDVELPETDPDPDYLNEHEAEPQYFD